MKTKQHHFVNNTWIDYPSQLNKESCQLLLAFGSPDIIKQTQVLSYLKDIYPSADIVFSSTGGEIIGSNVYDDSIVVTAIEFEKTKVSAIVTNINDHKDSFEAGKYLISQLSKESLRGIFIISDGTLINGGDLVDGLNSVALDSQIAITGGLAGDGPNFKNTYVGLNEASIPGNIVVVGFYGNNVSINHGCLGGWREFGESFTITKSDKNVLYEIDNQNALDLYKSFLGEYANELPGSALLFPLSLSQNDGKPNVVRTILSLDEEKRSMTFAGNLPVGSSVRLMEANFFRIIDAAASAAKNAVVTQEELDQNKLAIIVSCVGRKWILLDRINEEVQSAIDELGNVVVSGFYSYGEIAPFNDDNTCQLHNQTITITTISEE